MFVSRLCKPIMLFVIGTLILGTNLIIDSEVSLASSDKESKQAAKAEAKAAKAEAKAVRKAAAAAKKAAKQAAKAQAKAAKKAAAAAKKAAKQAAKAQAKAAKKAAQAAKRAAKAEAKAAKKAAKKEAAAVKKAAKQAARAQAKAAKKAAKQAANKAKRAAKQAAKAAKTQARQAAKVAKIDAKAALKANKVALKNEVKASVSKADIPAIMLGQTKAASAQSDLLKGIMKSDLKAAPRVRSFLVQRIANRKAQAASNMAANDNAQAPVQAASNDNSKEQALQLLASIDNIPVTDDEIMAEYLELPENFVEVAGNLTDDELANLATAAGGDLEKVTFVDFLGEDGGGLIFAQVKSSGMGSSAEGDNGNNLPIKVDGGAASRTRRGEDGSIMLGA